MMCCYGDEDIKKARAEGRKEGLKLASELVRSMVTSDCEIPNCKACFAYNMAANLLEKFDG